jgi:hypothetical protein
MDAAKRYRVDAEKLQKDVQGIRRETRQGNKSQIEASKQDHSMNPFMPLISGGVQVCTPPFFIS